MPKPKHDPIKLSSTGPEDPVDLVELFSLDDVSYKIPSRPRMNVALQLLDDMDAHGESMANLMLLRKLLGAEAYQALAGFDRLTQDQLSQVAQAAANLTLGTLEEASTAGN